MFPIPWQLEIKKVKRTECGPSQKSKLGKLAQPHIVQMCTIHTHTHNGIYADAREFKQCAEILFEKCGALLEIATYQVL